MLLVAYFGHHAIYGRYGLEAQSRLIERSAQLQREIRGLEAVQARLQRHVDLLDIETPSRDYVEELARRDLGFAYPSERIMRFR